MKRVIFWPNGNSMVFGDDGEQIGELQEPWVKLSAEYLATNGYNPEEFELCLPDGRKARYFKTESGYNWDIE